MLSSHLVNSLLLRWRGLRAVSGLNAFLWSVWRNVLYILALVLCSARFVPAGADESSCASQLSSPLLGVRP